MRDNGAVRIFSSLAFKYEWPYENTPSWPFQMHFVTRAPGLLNKMLPLNEAKNLPLSRNKTKVSEENSTEMRFILCRSCQAGPRQGQAEQLSKS